MIWATEVALVDRSVIKEAVDLTMDYRDNKVKDVSAVDSVILSIGRQNVLEELGLWPGCEDGIRGL